MGWWSWLGRAWIVLGGASLVLGSGPAWAKGQTVIFVLDASKSMAKPTPETSPGHSKSVMPRWLAAQTLLLQRLEMLAFQGGEAGLIVLGEHGDSVRTVARPCPKSIERIRSYLKTYQPRHLTPICEAMRQAEILASTVRGVRPSLVALTDTDPERCQIDKRKFRSFENIKLHECGECIGRGMKEMRNSLNQQRAEAERKAKNAALSRAWNKHVVSANRKAAAQRGSKGLLGCRDCRESQPWNHSSQAQEELPAPVAKKTIKARVAKKSPPRQSKLQKPKAQPPAPKPVPARLPEIEISNGLY